MDRRRAAPRIEQGPRRSLTHVGGPTHSRGDEHIRTLLERALDVGSSVASTEAEDAAREHVHGFHTYPARMHPTTARRLIESFSKPGDVVLDPFCGSGTVLVEARASGRVALGVDLNPLATMLARRKLARADEAEREALLAAATAIAQGATERRLARAGSSRNYGKDDVRAFDPHVLLELDGLRIGIEALDDAIVKDTLFLVLSSILVKLSKKRGDTSNAQRPTRIAAGYPAKLFVNKTRDLTARLATVAPAFDGAPNASVFTGDARDLRPIASSSVDLVVTSPPYEGVYDYLEHHKMRLRWLGLHDGQLEKREIGSRRELSALSPTDAHDRFSQQLGAVLSSLRRVLTPRGKIVILIADAANRRADDLVESIAARNRFGVSAVGSQRRPDFGPKQGRGPAKLEHAIVLTPAASRASPASQLPKSAPRKPDE